VFIGIDIGTSEVKALLLDDSQRILATGGAALALSRPHPGHSEQHPADWWLATQSALFALRRQQPGAYASVRALGLSGQMHGATLLDGANRVLRPAILWNDVRAADDCREMMEELPTLASIAGTLAMPGFTAPKLRWLMRNEPEVFARTRKVLLPKDYVRLMLTGEHVTDMSDASGTLWLDVAARTWSPELLALTRLDERHMPRLVEGCATGGALSSAAADLLGLPRGIVVSGGAGDNAASAVGMGCTSPGSGFVSLGTSGVIFVVTPRFQPNPESATHACCHALPGLWHQMSVMLTAASALTWAAGLLGMDSATALEAKAAATNPGQRRRAPLFLPYMSGERTPHNDARVRGSLHGLEHDTDAAAVGYAVIEGITFGLADGLQALRTAGSDAYRLSLVGGGARSAMWAQLIASCLGVQITTHDESSTGAALGAARLAWLAYGGDVRSACTQPPDKQVFTPDRREADLLHERLARFRSIYPALRRLDAAPPNLFRQGTDT
jgi:xylulokinase